MKQPNKLTAYYYRAAERNTDLYLDNQMHQLLHHAQEGIADAYALYADNGYCGLSLVRPAIMQLQRHMADGQISKIIVTDLDRISRDTLNMLIFFGECVKHGVGLETVNGEDLYEQLAMTQRLYEAMYTGHTAEKGGERK